MSGSWARCGGAEEESFLSCASTEEISETGDCGAGGFRRYICEGEGCKMVVHEWIEWDRLNREITLLRLHQMFRYEALLQVTLDDSWYTSNERVVNAQVANMDSGPTIEEMSSVGLGVGCGVRDVVFKSGNPPHCADVENLQSV